LCGWIDEWSKWDGVEGDILVLDYHAYLVDETVEQSHGFATEFREIFITAYL
jgi:hypothetical protein